MNITQILKIRVVRVNLLKKTNEYFPTLIKQFRYEAGTENTKYHPIIKNFTCESHPEHIKISLNNMERFTCEDA